MKYPRYPEYRPSGVDWLGEVPAHWQVDRLKWSVYGCINGIWGVEADGGNDDVVCVRVADFDRAGLRVDICEPTLRAVTDSERALRLLKRGDLLLEKSGGGATQPVGAVMQFDHDTEAVTSNFIARMPVAEGFDSRFLAYLHAHLYVGRVNTRTIKQTTGIQNLDSRAYLDELACYPPLDEQRAIAAFLDRETARIDALIATKRRFIALLQEKRAALISRAVTRGLDPDAPLKESGIVWVAPIPVQWVVQPLKRIAEVRTGVAKGRKIEHDETMTVPYLRVANVQDGYLDLEDVAEIEIGADELDRYALQTGDVLMNEGGDNDKLGRGHVWRGEVSPCIHQNHVFAVRPHAVRPDWLALVTSSDYAKHYFLSFAKQSTNLASISSTNLKNLPVILPPDDEQATILRSIEYERDRIDELQTRCESAIDHLIEHRVSLIAAAVTGKIDTRKPLKNENPSRHSRAGGNPRTLSP